MQGGVKYINKLRVFVVPLLQQEDILVTVYYESTHHRGAKLQHQG